MVMKKNIILVEIYNKKAEYINYRCKNFRKNKYKTSFEHLEKIKIF